MIDDVFKQGQGELFNFKKWGYRLTKRIQELGKKISFWFLSCG